MNPIKLRRYVDRDILILFHSDFNRIARYLHHLELNHPHKVLKFCGHSYFDDVLQIRILACIRMNLMKLLNHSHVF